MTRCDRCLLVNHGCESNAVAAQSAGRAFAYAGIGARAGVFVTGCCNPNREHPHVDRQGLAALESPTSKVHPAPVPHAGAAISGVNMRISRLSLAALCAV